MEDAFGEQQRRLPVRVRFSHSGDGAEAVGQTSAAIGHLIVSGGSAASLPAARAWGCLPTIWTV